MVISTAFREYGDSPLVFMTVICDVQKTSVTGKTALSVI